MGKQVFTDSYTSSHDKYYLSEEYLLYVIANIIYDYFEGVMHTFPSKEYVLERATNYFGQENVVVKNLNIFIDVHFTNQDIVNSSKIASITSQCRNAVKFSRSVKEQVENLLHKKPATDTKEAICLHMHKDDIDLKSFTVLMIQFEFANFGGDIIQYVVQTFTTLIGGEKKLMDDIDWYIIGVDKTCLTLPISILRPLSDRCREIFSLLGIKRIEQIAQLKDDVILGVFILHIQEILNAMKNLKLSDVSDEKYLQMLDDDLSVISDREKEVLRRYYLDCESINHIARKFNESTRTIINLRNNAVLKLRRKVREHIDSYYYYLSSHYEKSNDLDAKYSRLLKNKSNIIQIAIVLSVFHKWEKANANYYELLEALYRQQYIKGIKVYDHEYLNDYKNSHPWIEDEEYLNSAYAEKGDETDRLSQLYKSRSKSRDRLASVCDEFFPNGIRPSDPNDRKRLFDAYKARYGIEYQPPSPRVIASALMSRGYILCNRGTYINKSKVNSLPYFFVEKITSFINEQPMTNIYYSIIYNHFRVSLLPYGIDNVYLLKGLLDPKLDKTMVETHRDYIRKLSGENNGGTPKDEIKEYILSLSGKYSLNDLMEQFKGIADTLMLSILYDLQDEGALIFLPNKEFINVKDLNISQQTINELKNFVDETFEFQNCETLNACYVYEAIEYIKPDLLSKLEEAGESYFALFSLIYALFKNKYNFHRPNISLRHP